MLVSPLWGRHSATDQIDVNHWHHPYGQGLGRQYRLDVQIVLVECVVALCLQI